VRIRSLLLVTAVLSILVGARAQNNPLIGTWKLNVAKSKYDPASQAPKSGMTKIEAVGDGIRLITDGVNSKGQKTHTEYTAKFDGKDASRTATADGKPDMSTYNAVAVKKIDDYRYEFTNKFNGKTIQTQQTVIAPDGKSRTNTVTGTDTLGKPISNVQVYERQ
jgi:hypothetical protein